jgi:hypothetical protein
MKIAETCSCSLYNKLYAYFYHHIVVLDKYLHSYLVVWLSALRTGRIYPSADIPDSLRSCTLHVDSIKSFICPTYAHKLL